MMYSINKYGQIIEIEEHKIKKLAYFDQHYGIFETSEQATVSLNMRKQANKEAGGLVAAPSVRPLPWAKVGAIK